MKINSCVEDITKIYHHVYLITDNGFLKFMPNYSQMKYFDTDGRCKIKLIRNSCFPLNQCEKHIF